MRPMPKNILSESRHSVEISHRTIIFTAFFIIFLAVVRQIEGILVGIFVSYLIMAAVNPLVNFLEKFKIPRSLSAIVILIGMLSGIVSGIAALIPPIVDQTGAFLSQLPKLLGQLGVQLDQSLVSSQLGSIPQNAFKVISGVFSNALAVFTILVMSYYMILERQHLSGRLTNWFGDSETTFEDLLAKIEVKIGAWIRGQVILSLIIGGAVYIGLISLSIPYAVPLAIIAGLMESIPNIGPTVSMVPAAVVGFTISPLHGGAVVLLYFLIQQFENNLIVPLIMRRAVGLNPLVTIIALMVGLALGGVAGAVLSIPVVLIGEVLIPYFIDRSKGKN